MKFFYKSDIQFIIDSGYMPQSFLDSIKAESRTPDGEKLYLNDANFDRAYAIIASYVEDRWNNYWKNISLVEEDIDIVFPYYNERLSNYESLKYVLRSIETNLKASNINVWIVGDLPDWLSRQANYIQKERFGEHKRRKSIDSSQKILAAMNDSGIGDNILVMNDDQFFIKPTPIEVFRHPGAHRPWTEAQLNAWEEGNNWEFTRKKSMLHFLSRSPKTIAYDYSTHMPYLYNKTNFLTMASKYKIDQNHVLPNNIGVYCPEVLYYNEYPYDDPPKPALECISIFDDRLGTTNQNKMFSNAFVVNTSKFQFRSIKDRLASLFPNKSIYER